MEELNMTESIGPIVATAEHTGPADAAFAEMDRRIRDLEAAIGDLRTVKAQGDLPVAAGRKTLPASQVSLLAKGSSEVAGGASIDDALRSLSVEQRIAVKSGLMRAGLMR